MSFFGLETYELQKEQELMDINSKGYILRHKKSGARIALISNDDDNKVFYIGFRTPPTNETGVPHIVEHSVLCGSEKFPIKDPFVELVKGSLNTFLNAMTYPDKTLYPVASYNDKDFKNLMDVYMDAVLHPNILKCQEIFKQEGWHYELEDKDAPITINGVVYNEMKGAYSSPDEMLQNCIYQSLYPDNTYGKDSGGNPDYIPELSYEEFLAFYKKYYHPSNSYIYLYGDFDIKERLEWMDREYLSQYDVLDVDSAIQLQTAFSEMKKITGRYPIASEESEEGNTYFSYSKVIGNVLDKTLNQAFAILDYALVSVPGAPVRQALLDAGIGQDVYGVYEEGILQPNYTIYAKNANAGDKERFVEVIEESLKKVVAEGINKNSIMAAINSTEFAYREADYGHYPKGLLYGLQCMDTWLFDDMQPFVNLELLDTFAFLREQVDTGYFEELVQKYLLDNTHGAVVSMEPEKGMNNAKELELEKKLEAYKRTLSEDELEKLIADTNSLKAYQEEETTEEDLKKIPMLKREDMRKDVRPYSNIEEVIDNVPVIRHDILTNGIEYISFFFDADDVATEDVPILGLLRNILAFVDTKNYSYSELSNAINIHTGGISSSLGIFPNAKDANQNLIKYEFRVKVLEDKLEDALQLLQEIVLTSKLDDVKRLTEILGQCKSRLQSILSSSGHMVSATRSMAYFSQYAYFQDATSGIAYYDTICKLDAQIRKEPEVVVGRLKKIVNTLFGKGRLLIGFTGTQSLYECALPKLKNFIKALPQKEKAVSVAHTVLGQQNEAFTDASAIQYVSRSGNYVAHGFAYTGALHILKMILNYDYLWNNVRVKGGAYGCNSSFLRTGEAYFTSYRDPNLRKTNEIYEGIPGYLRDFTADEREMTKYIIGTLGALDTPLYPEGMGHRSMIAYLRNLSIEDIQKERNQILNATEEDIQALAGLVEAVLSDGHFCVLGNENNIRKEETMFSHIRSLSE